MMWRFACSHVLLRVYKWLRGITLSRDFSDLILEDCSYNEDLTRGSVCLKHGKITPPLHAAAVPPNPHHRGLNTLIDELTFADFAQVVDICVPSLAGMRLLYDKRCDTCGYQVLSWLYLTPTPPSVYEKLPVLGVYITLQLYADIRTTVEPTEMDRGCMVKAKPWAVMFDKALAPEIASLAIGSPARWDYPCGCVVYSSHAAIEGKHCNIWRRVRLARGHCSLHEQTRPHDKVVEPGIGALERLGAKYLVGLDYWVPPECSQADGKQLLPAGRVWRDICQRTRALFEPVWATGSKTPRLPNWTNIAVSNLLLCSEHDPGVFSVVQRLIGFGCGFLSYVKAMKLLHTHVRVTGVNLFSGVFSDTAYRRSLYGLDYIAGRSDHYKLSFINEMMSRNTPSSIRGFPTMVGKQLIFSKERYTAVFKEEVDRALREAINPVVNLLSYDQLMDRRLNWVSSGSAPGVKLEYEGADGKVEKLSVNKRLAFSHLDTEGIKREMQNLGEAVLHSRHATKYEPGKKRALWNTGLMHYSTSSVLLEQVANNEKKNLAWYMPSHTSAFSLHQDLLRVQALLDWIGLMWDFSDFNINHVLEHMAYLYIRAAEIMCERNRSGVGNEEVMAAAKWIAAATLETWLEDVDSGITMRARRSLMTGIRGTSFVNTYLNRVYTRMAERWIYEAGGGDVLIPPTYAFGDDVFAKTPRHADAVLFCHAMNTLGTAGTTYKINLELGELLRVSYDKDSFSGYPLRALVGLVSGEFFQSTSINDMHQRAAAFHEQLSKCTHRKVNLDMRKWTQTLMDMHCYVKITRGKSVFYKRPILELLYVPQPFGGLGLIRTEAPKWIKLHEWTQGKSYPQFKFDSAFSRMIVGDGFRDRSLIAGIPGVRDIGKTTATAEAEIGDSIVGGNAPRGEIRSAYDTYSEGLITWYKALKRGKEIDLGHVSGNLFFDSNTVEDLWQSSAEGLEPGHVYGSAAGVASMAGFSSNSAFTIVLKDLVHVHGNLPLALYALARRTMPWHMVQRVARIASVLANVPAVYQYTWFNGEFGLLPVRDTGSSKVNSCIRWITMYLVERQIHAVVRGQDRRMMIVRVAALEEQVRRLVLNKVKRVVKDFSD
ncbi:RNA-dependent RNA polymerase [Phytophthora fragariae fusagravirus 1]|nr:RNA-dependent RNA polymerase [Phytophthora fragariae fusagravirus 1]